MYANQKCRLRKQFARIHNVIWIKVLFDAFHQGDFGRRAYFVQPLFFDDTYAVFGGNRAVAGKDVAIDCAVDVVFVTIDFIAEDFGQESIVVQAAVAQMSEADDLYAFEILFQIFGAPADKVGNAPDRNGNIVFDAGAQFALRCGDVFAQRPHMDTRQYRV